MSCVLHQGMSTLCFCCVLLVSHREVFVHSPSPHMCGGPCCAEGSVRSREYIVGKGSAAPEPESSLSLIDRGDPPAGPVGDFPKPKKITCIVILTTYLCG